MATLIAMSTAVSAGFIEFIFGEEYEVAATSSKGSSDYTYTGQTMENVCSSNGWTLDNDNNICNSSGEIIGRYDPCIDSHQEPHFHLNSAPGVHYIL